MFRFLSPLNSNSQSFEGVFRLEKTTPTDTMFFEYFVKDNLIRINQVDKYGNLIVYRIIDLSKNEVLRVNPEQKIYMHETPIAYNEMPFGNLEVRKEKNHKKINGYTCYQWRVRNKSTQTEVVYWVAQDGFKFFDKMIKLIRHSDSSMLYFLSIKESEGYFPMFIEEMSFTREKFSKLKVTSIVEQDINNDKFVIPDNYTVYKRR